MNNSQSQRLKRGLEPEQQNDLGDLGMLEASLQGYDTPEPDSAALLANLQAYMPTPQAAPHPNGWQYWLNLARSQLTLVDTGFWWGSLFLLALGTVLSFAGGGGMAVIYALLSPMLAVAGTAYIFRPEARSLREFEVLSAVKPLELLYARLLLLLTYNAGLAFALILLAWSQGAQLVLWRLLLIWFGPLIGFTGVALYVSLRWSSLAGMIVPMGLWSILIGIGWRDAVYQSPVPLQLVDAVAFAVRQSNTFLFAALAALVLGLFLFWQIGRRIARQVIA